MTLAEFFGMKEKKQTKFCLSFEFEAPARLEIWSVRDRSWNRNWDLVYRYIYPDNYEEVVNMGRYPHDEWEVSLMMMQAFKEFKELLRSG